MQLQDPGFARITSTKKRTAKKKNSGAVHNNSKAMEHFVDAASIALSAQQTETQQQYLRSLSKLDEVFASLQNAHSTAPEPTAIPALLKPRAFFLAFHGTLTLAFSGWPTNILQLKENVQLHFEHTIQPELYGSKWPKVTLGVLPKQTQFSRNDFTKLLQILAECNAQIVENFESEELDAAQLMLYEKRSMEPPYLAQKNFPLLQQNLVNCEIAPTSVTFVEKVLAEAQDTNEYFSQVNNNQRRVEFYNEVCTPPELTLIHFLSSPKNFELLKVFKEKIEKEFPNMYMWFPDNWLHVTVRAFNPFIQ